MATSNNGENWYFRKKWDDFRRGDLKVELRFDGQRAVARLYDLGVPETVRMLTAQMPFAVPVVHVAWSGDMVMSAQPFDFGPTEAENAVRLPRVGSDLGSQGRRDLLYLRHCRSTSAVWRESTGRVRPGRGGYRSVRGILPRTAFRRSRQDRTRSSLTASPESTTSIGSRGPSND
jgi:hypothetical protein